MKGIHAFLRSRAARLALLVVVLGGTLALLAPVDVAQSFTCAFRPWLRHYYDDDAHTTLVGERGLDCMCNEVNWGVTTSYVVIEVQCCPQKTC